MPIQQGFGHPAALKLARQRQVKPACIHSRSCWQSLELRWCFCWVPDSQAHQLGPEIGVVWWHTGKLEGQVVNMEERTAPKHLNQHA